MGTYYFAVSHSKKQIFELGKHMQLHDDLDEVRLYDPNRAYVPPVSREDLDRRINYALNILPGEPRMPWADKLSDALWDMGVEACYSDEHDDERLDECMDYILIGTVYVDYPECTSLIGKPFKTRYGYDEQLQLR